MVMMIDLTKNFIRVFYIIKGNPTFFVGLYEKNQKQLYDLDVAYESSLISFDELKDMCIVEHEVFGGKYSYEE